MHAIRLNVADSSATVTWFDYETAVAVNMDASGNGNIVLPVADLLAAVKTLGGKGVAQFTVTDSIHPTAHTDVTISVDGMSTTVTLPLWEDLPNVPVVNSAPIVTVTGEQFANVATAVGAAVGTDDTLPMLTGVRLEVLDNEVHAATTDRFRLVDVTVPSIANADDTAVLIPGRAVTAFGKFSTKSQSVTVSGVSDGWVVLQSDTARVTVRAMDAQFPKFRQLFPLSDDYSATFTVDPAVLGKRLKALSANSFQVAFNISQSGIKATAAERHGDGETSFSVNVGDLVARDNLTAAFNPEYLASILLAVPNGQKATMSVTTPARPAVITWEGVRALLMPVRIPGTET